MGNLTSSSPRGKKIYENVGCFLVLLLVLFVVYLVATFTFAKSSPLFNVGPRHGESNVIRVKINDPNDIKEWIKRTDHFLEEFLPNDTLSNRVKCDFNDPPSAGKFCMNDIQHWPTACSSKNGYGFRNGTPCVFLNLNPEADWLPDYFDKVQKLPKEMPEELRKHIETQHSTKLRQVWVSCVIKDEGPENKVGKLHFIPWHGFPSFFYPARHNMPGYSKPLVAVQFENLKPNVEINVECRAWAKNIPKGSQKVDFKLFVDTTS